MNEFSLLPWKSFPKASRDDEVDKENEKYGLLENRFVRSLRASFLVKSFRISY